MLEDGSKMLMMRGMTAKNFDPVRYSGRWFEVASLKRGFAGQGQEDCHCTQVNIWLKTSLIRYDEFTVTTKCLSLKKLFLIQNQHPCMNCMTLQLNGIIARDSAYDVYVVEVRAYWRDTCKSSFFILQQ